MKYFLYKNKILKNVIGMVSLRILGIISNFLLLGLIYRYISNDELYGIWLTVSSILSFIYLFDLGIGNGLRNKLTESIYQKNKDLSTKYVTTAYLIMLVPTVFLIISTVTIFPFINWNEIFTTEGTVITKEYFSKFMCIIMLMFIIQFYLTMIFSILHSIYKSYITVLIQFLINILNIVVILLLYFIEYSDLIILGIVYVGSSIFVLALSTIKIFNSHKDLFSIRFSYFDTSLIKPLINIGIQFLVLQFAIFILFNTDNILISKLIGAGDVTPYFLINKLFSVFTVILEVVLTPIWTLIIEYNTSQSLMKIRKAMIKVMKLYGVLIIGLIIIAFLSPYIIRVWMGTYISIDITLVASLIVFTLLHMWCNIFRNFLNGMSRLKIQILVYSLASVTNIPLSIFLFKVTELGVTSIVIGTIFALFIPALVLPIYTYKILKSS